MVDSRKYFGSNFVTLADVAEGPQQVTIDSVAEGKFGKLDATFAEGSALGLNATNARTLAKAYGGETDGWIGKVVELVAGEVEYQGKLQPSVLVRPITAPTKTSPPAPPPKAGDLNDKIPW